MKKLLKTFKILIAVCAIGLPTIAFSQTDPGGDPGGGFTGDNSPCSGINNVDDVPCPFDGGVSLLVVAGIGYGVKKGYDKKKLVRL